MTNAFVTASAAADAINHRTFAQMNQSAVLNQSSAKTEFAHARPFFFWRAAPWEVGEIISAEKIDRVGDSEHLRSALSAAQSSTLGLVRS